MTKVGSTIVHVGEKAQARAPAMGTVPISTVTMMYERGAYGQAGEARARMRTRTLQSYGRLLAGSVGGVARLLLRLLGVGGRLHAGSVDSALWADADGCSVGGWMLLL